MAPPHLHESHPAVLKRLKRASGHLQTVICMIADGRECVDVVQQLHAVERAIRAAKTALIHDHVDHCLDHTAAGPHGAMRRALSEFKDLAKYL